MNKKPIEVPPTRARVIRQRVQANGDVIKSAINIPTRLTPAEKRQIALQIEWEKWLRLRLR